MSAVHYCNPLFTAIDWPTGCWCRSRNVVYLNQVRYLIKKITPERWWTHQGVINETRYEPRNQNLIEPPNSCHKVNTSISIMQGIITNNRMFKTMPRYRSSHDAVIVETVWRTVFDRSALCVVFERKHIKFLL